MSKPDDLEAVRQVVEILKPFEAPEQERIIRWAREKMGTAPAAGLPAAATPPPVHHAETAKDIRAFVAEKKPTSDTQFVAVVAYFHRFVSAEGSRKDQITADDVVEACRQVNWKRPPRPAQTMVNAFAAGILDKGDGAGTYSLNTVGENLVAMTLPSAESRKAAPRRAKQPRRMPKRGKRSNG